MENIKHLSIGDDRNDVYYLGYNLKLTPSEYKIVLAIAKGVSVSADALLEEIGVASCKKGNVSVHICSINRKARLIGERQLIIFENSKYRFNDNM